MIYPHIVVNSHFLSRGFTSNHQANDYGWHDENDKHAPIYPWLDGTVVERSDDGNSSHGKYLTFYHGVVDLPHYGKHKCWTRVQHGDGFLVKAGDHVTMFQQVAHRSNTGRYKAGGKYHAYPVHTHMALYLDALDAPGKYAHAVDPQLCTYIWPGQVCENSAMKNMPVPVPVEKNPTVHQIQVTSETLRVRKAPGKDGAIIGFAMTGYYNVTGIAEADGLQWAQIGDCYMAIVKGSSIDYPVVTVEALQARIRALEAQISQDDQSIAALKNQAQALQAQALAQADKIAKAKEALQ